LSGDIDNDVSVGFEVEPKVEFSLMRVPSDRQGGLMTLSEHALLDGSGECLLN